jgi:hypothetical protein
MGMARLPVLKRRRSKRQRALDMASKAKERTTATVSSVTTRATNRVPGRPLLKVAAVPVAVAGGVVVWRKAHNGSDSNGASADANRSVGPVASAESVSPPADAAAAAAHSDEGHSS